MTFKEIQELIRLVSKSKLSEFKLKDGEFQLSIRTDVYNNFKKPTNYSTQTPQIVSMTPAAIQSDVTADAMVSGSSPEIETTVKTTGASGGITREDSSNSGYIEVKSPMVGTFYRAPSPEKSAYVQVGDVIHKDSVVCIIEAMKLFNEIEAEISGKIVKVLVDDAKPVEYDQPLFLVDPNG